MTPGPGMEDGGYNGRSHHTRNENHMLGPGHSPDPGSSAGQGPAPAPAPCSHSQPSLAGLSLGELKVGGQGPGRFPLPCPPGAQNFGDPQNLLVTEP